MKAWNYFRNLAHGRKVSLLATPAGQLDFRENQRHAAGAPSAGLINATGSGRRWKKLLKSWKLVLGMPQSGMITHSAPRKKLLQSSRSWTYELFNRAC